MSVVAVMKAGEADRTAETTEIENAHFGVPVFVGRTAIGIDRFYGPVGGLVTRTLIDIPGRFTIVSS